MASSPRLDLPDLDSEMRPYWRAVKIIAILAVFTAIGALIYGLIVTGERADHWYQLLFYLGVTTGMWALIAAVIITSPNLGDDPEVRYKFTIAVRFWTIACSIAAVSIVLGYFYER